MTARAPKVKAVTAAAGDADNAPEVEESAPVDPPAEVTPTTDAPPAEPADQPAGEAPAPEPEPEPAAPAEPEPAGEPEPEPAAEVEPEPVEPTVRAVVLVGISGLRNGEPWPSVGGVIELPAEEAAGYVQFGYVELIDA